MDNQELSEEQMEEVKDESQTPHDPDLEQIRKTFPEARRDESGMIVYSSGDPDSPLGRRYRRLIREMRCIGGTQFVEWE